MNPLPDTAVDLVDELNRDYPHRCPHVAMTERQIWMDAGKRELVDNLITRKDMEDKQFVFERRR